MRIRLVTLLTLGMAAGVLALSFPAARLLGFATNGHVWGGNRVVYYVNPQSVWVSPSLATAAVQTGADAWTQQTSANIQLVYGGPTSGAALTLNNKNEVFFRNDTSGYLAETYWWWDGSGRLVDADIVFHEGYHYYAFSGCTDGGVYIEGVAVHEFGHALGLGHSAEGGATMYPNIPSWCDTSMMALDADDIAGIQALYPPSQVPAAPSQAAVSQNTTTPNSSLRLSWQDNATNESSYQIDRSADGVRFLALTSVGANAQSFTDSGLSAGTLYSYRVRAVNATGASAYSNVAAGTTASASGTNTPPTVTINTPYNSSAYPGGTTISFSGTANDSTDGNISSKVVWTSNLDGQIGAGASFSRALSPGNHVITARVTDSGALSGTAQVAVTVGASQTPAPTLTARGYKVKGVQKVDLGWTGFATASVDVYRSGAKVLTTTNDGSQTDSINAKGGGSYSYKACESGTATCSAVVSVTF